jgi:phosphohistidine swiveling domain-containing protein
MKNTSVTNSHQVSLTEWLAGIGEESEAQAFRVEDNSKASRLVILMDEIGLPYRPPVVIPAVDVLKKAPVFQELLDERADEAVAYRLTPDDPALPKLRNRGLTLKDCYDQWFSKLDIDFSRYNVEIFPNETDIAWSTIFVINNDAIFGEIVRGPHSQLTLGDMVEKPIQFKYNYSTWEWSVEDEEAKKEVDAIVAALHVPDKATQQRLHELLKSEFAHDYLVGYFESTAPRGKVEFFIDYNRILSRYIPTPETLVGTHDALPTFKGVVAYKGVVEGEVFKVTHESVLEMVHAFPEGAILVSENTDVRYLPLMSKAGAIITEKGGMLSHAAIIARELKKPTLVAVKGGMSALTHGQRVRVDATSGIVTII